LIMNKLQRIQPPLLPVETGLIPEARICFLRNKIPVYLIKAGTEDITRMEFVFRAGQIKEYLPLLSSTTNMMLTEGSQNYSSEELNQKFDYYGSQINLSSEKDCAGFTVYFLGKHIKKILELSREVLFRPVFPHKEFNILTRKRIQWYRLHRERVQNLAMDKFFESVFGKHHPYGKQIVEGDFETITPELLMDFHSKYYRPENMAVIVSGRIHKNMIDFIDSCLGDLNPQKIYIEDSKSYLQGGKTKKIKIQKPGAVQSAIRIGSTTINKRHPHYPGLKVLNSVLGGYFGSRLMKNIREEKGYTYGIYSSLSSLDLSGFKVISTEAGKKNSQKTIDEIYKEIRLLQTRPVKKEELSVVKNYMSGEMVRMFDGPFALAESFKAVWEFGLDNAYYYRLAEKIKSIDPDEIIELAQTYYNIDELYEIIAG